MTNPPSMINIAASVEQVAQQQPNTIAIYYPQRDWRGRLHYSHYSYAELLAASDQLARGLEAYGIRRGMRAVLMLRPSLEFFALMFALLRAGIVPVIVDPGMGIKNLKLCLAEAQPQAFIGIPRAQIARLLMGWGRGTVRQVVTVGPRLAWGGVSLETIKRLGASAGDAPYHTVATRADETAAIIFTSGSTGVPKGVVYTHGNLAAQLELLRHSFGIQPGEIDLPTFPIFALFDPALGMTTVIPEMDFTRPAAVDPRKIITAIEHFGVTNMFGSPALLNRVGRYGAARGVKLPTLKRVFSAGAPVPTSVLERFTRLLDDAADIHTVYGATEALPVADISHHDILAHTAALTDQGAGVCVGKPLIPTAIIRISDDPIPTWSDDLCLPANEIGEIVVRGANVTGQYFNRERSTQLAKIAAPEDAATDESAGAATGAPTGAFYHRMGDLGYLDEQGRLWFCGRKAHRVITAAGTLFTVPVEAVFNTHPALFRSALVGVPQGDSQQPVLCVELEKDARIAPATLEAELRALGAQYPHTAQIQQFLRHPAFPVDIRHNSKIFREKLALWAQKELEA